MKVIVLMCLLHADFAFSANHPWPQTTDPSTTNVCVSGKSSCRCCLMVQEVVWLMTYLNNSLNEIEEEYNETIQVLHQIKESRTAFSVALQDTFGCFGVFDTDRTIVYQHVFLNLGGAYNETSGIFTVPYCGVYSIAITIYSDAGSPGNILAACANLVVNDQVVAGPRELNRADQEDSASINVALYLTAGDQVSVSLPAGCFLCDDQSHYNTFSAFLLNPSGEAEYA